MNKKQDHRARFWKKKRVLVTGANGFIGSWLALRLLKYEAEVVALTRGELFNPIFCQKTRPRLRAVVKTSLNSAKSLENIFHSHKIDTCFHLAAQPLVVKANQSPLPTFRANIEGAWNILEAARKSGLSRLIVASADKAYGQQKKLPYREDAPLKGDYPYGASKACADILSRTYYHTFGLPVAVARCSNVYGGKDFNFSRIIPQTIRSVLNNKAPVIRGDGRSLRDFVFIDDVIDAYLALAQALGCDNVKGEAFNFGSGRPTSITDIVKKIIQISKKETLEPEILGKYTPEGEIDRQFLCIEKAKRILSWQPRYKLEEGLRLTINWYIDFFKKNG